MIDIVVMAGAMLVAFAASLVMRLQLALGWEVAGLVGLAIFAVAAVLHILIQRTEEIARLRTQMAAMEQELTAIRRGRFGAPPHAGAMPGNLQGGPPPIPMSGRSRQGDGTAGHQPAPQQPGNQNGPQGASNVNHAGHQAAPQAHPHHRGADWPQSSIAPATAPAMTNQAPQARPFAPRQVDVVGTPTTPTILIEAAPLEPAPPANGSPAIASAAARSDADGARSSSPPASPTPPVEVPPAKKRRGFLSALTGKIAGAEDTSDKTAATAPAPLDAADSEPARTRVINGWQAPGRSPPVTWSDKSAMDSAPPEVAIGTQAAQLSSQGDASPHREPQPVAQRATQPARQDGRLHQSVFQQATIQTAAVQSAEVRSAGPTNSVDQLIQSIAQGLAIEHEGLATEDLLALPAPYPEASEPPVSPEAIRTGSNALGSNALGSNALGSNALGSNAPGSPPPISSELADAVRQAIEAGRVEVHLQPILSLAGMATVSYEAFARLRDARGTLLKPDAYTAFAHRAGLSAGIEKLALLRTIHVLQQLDARGKLSPIFINVSRELLSDGRFFADFIDAMKGARNLSTCLVLEFSQPVASSFDEEDLESLDTLARLGFTFALDNVDHVEMDFATLIARGLAFVKVSADVFRHGLIAGEAMIPTDEIRSLFEDAGLQLIVHHITDEAALDVVLSQSVTFGQGNVFAEPKPVKAEVLGSTPRAA